MIRARFGLLLILVAYCSFPVRLSGGEDTEATKKLKARSSEFREDVIEVTKGVYAAVGYSVANVSMIVGADGIIIIDTGLDPVIGKKILGEFRKITEKPVKAVIYTHGHGDHTGGALAFVADANPQVWARANFGSEDRPLAAAGLTIQRLRGVRQAGFALPPEDRINNGIAPAQKPPRRDDAFARGSVPPNHTFSEPRRKLEIAGVKLVLVAAPGETDDQLYVWLPEKKVLFCGDTFYKSFPNLYAIRGTPYRSVLDWANSLDMMLKENPEFLVAGHTRPILGARQLMRVLADYRDAVRFVHDKTVEGMNKGLSPDQLVAYVALPPELAKKDYLQEFYGNLQWSVRSIFNGYLGWFDGNPVNLFPLGPKEEARRIAELAGGEAALLTRAEKALDSGDPQWAARLVDYLLALNPKAVEPKRIKANALTALGLRCMTATGRNYYLTVARELREEIGEGK